MSHDDLRTPPRPARPTRRAFLRHLRDLALFGAVGAPLMLTASGCAVPQVKLERALLQKLSTTAMEVGLQFDFFNPNDFSLPLQGIAWKIHIHERPFTRGSVEFRRKIPPSRHIEALVPLTIDIRDLYARLVQVITGPKIPWRIEGQCNFRGPQGTFGANFGLEGSWKNPLRRR